MRVGYKYVDAEGDRAVRTDLDATVDDFRESNAYDGLRFETADEFLAFSETDWMVDLRQVLHRLLEKERSILSIGSGKGEHEVPLFLEGYDIVASEIVVDALDDAKRLFPGFRAIPFDILDPPRDASYDDILMTGIDAPFDDDQLALALANAREALNPHGRVIFVLRYHDNLATRLIDRALLPAEAALRRRRHRRLADGRRTVRRQHGYRRRRSEVVAIAERCGYEVGRAEHAMFGMEMKRLLVTDRTPRLVAGVKRIDRRLQILNSATAFELLT